MGSQGRVGLWVGMLNVFTATLKVMLDLSVKSSGRVRSSLGAESRGSGQAGKSYVSLGNMDGHRIVTQFESVRLTDTKCFPNVSDSSGCTRTIPMAQVV